MNGVSESEEEQLCRRSGFGRRCLAVHTQLPSVLRAASGLLKTALQLQSTCFRSLATKHVRQLAYTMRPLHALLCLAGATAITPRRGTKALSLRGGTFCEFEAKQTGEQCGIEEPEKEVVKTIKASVLFPFKVLGIRGGSDEADEEDEDDVDVDEEEASDFR